MTEQEILELNQNEVYDELQKEFGQDALKEVGSFTQEFEMEVARRGLKQEYILHVKSFLGLQGKDINSVPAEGEQVFLRKNSNISTGGDSIDFTDIMSATYKEIAIQATRAVGARICGADMIISGSIAEPELDSLASHYSVIELNFNPAIHIHDYPNTGINRHAEKFILDLLGF